VGEHYFKPETLFKGIRFYCRVGDLCDRGENLRDIAGIRRENIGKRLALLSLCRFFSDSDIIDAFYMRLLADVSCFEERARL
jgi:hypothetical protein